MKATALGLLAGLAVVAGGQIVMRTAAARSGEDPGRNATWVRWDSYRYIGIARDGYIDTPEDPLGSNTGWFPGYPLLMRLVAGGLRVKPALAGRMIAVVFTVALLALLWTALLPPGGPGRSALALLVAGFFPGWVYWHAVFPLSMVIFFSLAAIALAARRRYAAAGACGAFGAFSYPTGALVVLPLAIQVLREDGLSRKARGRALLAGPALAGLGLVAVFVLMQAKVGRWDAYVSYQRQFGHGFHDPLAVLADRLRPIAVGALSPELLVAVQTALVTLLLAGAVVLVWRDRSRPVDSALLTLGAALWLLVHTAGPNLSAYRPAAGLVCLVPILARAGTRTLALLAAVLVALGYGMSTLFFRNVLV